MSHHDLSWPDPWVHATVTIGSRSSSTGGKRIPLGRDIGDLAGDRLGPFTWKWGDPDVSIGSHHEGASPDDLIATFGVDDAFKVRHLNDLTPFREGTIAVRLECPEVVPPVLPPYKKD
jgi:hypothetical protein